MLCPKSIPYYYTAFKINKQQFCHILLILPKYNNNVGISKRTIIANKTVELKYMFVTGRDRFDAILSVLEAKYFTQIFVFYNFKKFYRYRDMSDKKISKFLRKLFSILDNEQYQCIIAWDSCGQSIIIKDQYRLQNQIIPLNFSLKKFSSFIRQLHLYNFHKKKSKCGYLVFYNSYFQRECRQLALKVIRKRKTKAQLASMAENKGSQKTIQFQNDQHQDQYSIYQVGNEQPQNQQYCKSIESILLKSYSQLDVAEQDPYDILNIM